MSWHTQLQVQNLGGAAISVDDFEKQILDMLRRDGISADLFGALREAFESGEATCHVDSVYLYQLFEELTPLIPALDIEVRCLGEEFRHTWIRAISNGEVTLEVGPWDYE